ncbi:hypothetical protein D5400_20590 [Georhizobium profundi]|uniref:Uncharacterized protein n=1 Tax=Georhizobium profundi TaxID=2341112 RepID=A0A3Q8XR22_9HYPH|nr:hypothetical protein D5400_20590 [Georhizobium profundi]
MLELIGAQSNEKCFKMAQESALDKPPALQVRSQSQYTGDAKFRRKPAELWWPREEWPWVLKSCRHSAMVLRAWSMPQAAKSP